MGKDNNIIMNGEDLKIYKNYEISSKVSLN